MESSAEVLLFPKEIKSKALEAVVIPKVNKFNNDFIVIYIFFY